MLEWLKQKKLFPLILIFGIIIFTNQKIYLMDFPITNFDNLTLGMATARNIDISKAILWYMIYAVPLCFLFAFFFNKSFLYKKSIEFLSRFEINLGESDSFLIVIILSFILLGRTDIFSVILTICFGLIVIFIKEKEIVLSAWLSAILAFSIPIFFASQFIFNVEILFSIFAIVLLIFLSSQKNISSVFVKLYPFVIAGIADFILLNLLEIFLVRGYSISDNILILPYILAGISLFFLKPSAEKNYDKKVLRGSLILAVFLFTPVLGNGGYFDFFEGANHGLTIEDFATGRGLPLIDNFDAHMLSLTLGGIIYLLLSGDYFGALLSPYFQLILMLLGLPSLFWLLKKFFSENQAFIILVIFPFGGVLSIFPGLIAISLFYFWKNNPDFKKSLLVQITISLLCLYRIDLGASFGFALFLCPILFCLIHKQYKILAQYFLAAILWATAFFSVVWSLDFEFAKEFLTAFNSNQNWAYGDLGKVLRVELVYFVVPALIAIFLLPILQKIIRKQEQDNDWIFLFLYVTFFFGISRMMVRHTFVELAIGTYVAEILLFALLVSSVVRSYKVVAFVGVFFIYVASCTHAQQDSVMLHVSSVSVAVNSVHLKQDEFFKYPAEDDKNQITAYKNFFDSMLKPDETYLDFSNQTLFFATVGRKSPVYINQFPAMVNGVKGQLQALQTIEKKIDKIKFVVMPYLQRPNVQYSCLTTIDGILNLDRYYLLTEYITKHYRPFCRVGFFAVWCKKSEYETLRSKDIADNTNREYLDYNYELPENHNHYLQNIPYLWGKSFLQTKIIDFKDVHSILNHTGFITMEITSNEDIEAWFKLYGEKIADIVYSFKVKPGKNLYRFRVSSDILWQSDLIKNFDYGIGNAKLEKIYFEEVEQ